jgi:hypothetical protein
LRRSVDQIYAALMPSALKRCFQPNLDKLEGGFEAHHPLAKRKHIGVVVLPA